MSFEFVDELPAGARKPKVNKVFTEDLVDALRENPGRWALVKGATAQGAAAWVKEMRKTEPGYEYQTVDTGKPNGEPRRTPRGEGTYQPTLREVYVRYNPDGS